MEFGQMSAELIIILVLAVLILIPLALIGVSKVCCSIISVYSDYKSDKQHRLQYCGKAETDSEVCSTVKSEKAKLIDSCSRLEQETGIRLDNYPYVIDYRRTAGLTPLIPLAAKVARRNSNDSNKSGVSANSQALGSDSPSEPYSDVHVVHISDDESSSEHLGYTESSSTDHEVMAGAGAIPLIYHEFKELVGDVKSSSHEDSIELDDDSVSNSSNEASSHSVDLADAVEVGALCEDVKDFVEEEKGEQNDSSEVNSSNSDNMSGDFQETP